jgi:hypothetical protein
MTQPNNYVLEGGASNQVTSLVKIFLNIRQQFHTSILLSNWILTSQQTSIWNLGSDAYFEYTSCNFKVVTLFIRNLFRVRLPYLLLLLPSTLIPLSGVGTTCFHHVVIKIRHLFLRPAACLTSTLLEAGVDANDCKCSRDQKLNVPSEAPRSSR